MPRKRELQEQVASLTEALEEARAVIDEALGLETGHDDDEDEHEEE